MKSSLIYVAALAYFAGLISFEAAQQHYYITRFDLTGNGEVTIMGLISHHAIRWVIWSILAVPFGIYIVKNPARRLSLRHIVRYGIVLIITLLVTLLAITLIVLQPGQQSLDQVREAFLFFTYQKAALFTNAYLALIVLLNLYKNVKLLDSKMLELSDLKMEYRSIYDELSNRIKDDTPLIQIKTGNKIKNLLLSDIVWVQSDDYCVKIHTEEGSYNLRKSMKLMEKELEPRGFIRLHRNSIVNKDQVDTLVYATEPHVTLKNGQTLPIAAGRVSKVKELFKGYLGLPA